MLCSITCRRGISAYLHGQGIVQNGYVGEGSDATTGDKEKFHSGVVVSAMGHLDATSGGSH
jgi:hypothetical protein